MNRTSTKSMCVRGAVGLAGWLLVAGAGCSTSVPDSVPDTDVGVVPIPTDGDARCPDGGLPELCDDGGYEGGDVPQGADAGLDVLADRDGTDAPSPDVPDVPPPLDTPLSPDACAAQETCNGRDDDCDGQIDEDVTQSCYTGPAGTRDVGACRAGTMTCSAGAWGTCLGQTLPATSETCNGRDDDCDGQIDEGFGEITCGTGACMRTVPRCMDGREQTCMPNGAAPEMCNNLDDDCDGQVDENVTQSCYTGPAGTRDVGACRAGTQMCNAGMFGACTGQTLPATETCNGVDDDCDGQVDEGLGTISCGVGACTRTVPACAAGRAASCAPGAPGVEFCNGVDDDCDGAVDENLSRACGSSTGECRPGVQTCEGGRWSTACVGERAAQTETCDGRDNDCNGSADETFACSSANSSRTCNVCGRSVGRQTCNASACVWIPECVVGTLPAVEAFYVGNDPVLRGTIGAGCSGGGRCMGGGTGFLSQGPNVPLGVANYRVNVRASANAGSISVEVVDADTGLRLAGPDRRGSGLDFFGRHGDVSVALPFTVPAGATCRRIDVRVTGQAESNGGVNLYDVTIHRDSHYRL